MGLISFRYGHSIYTPVKINQLLFILILIDTSYQKIFNPLKEFLCRPRMNVLERET